jgi:hypothetical protein
MFGLIWAIHRHAEVIGLLRGEPGKFHPDLFQVEARDFSSSFFDKR